MDIHTSVALLGVHLSEKAICFQDFFWVIMINRTTGYNTATTSDQAQNWQGCTNGKHTNIKQNHLHKMLWQKVFKHDHFPIGFDL